MLAVLSYSDSVDLFISFSMPVSASSLRYSAAESLEIYSKKTVRLMCGSRLVALRVVSSMFTGPLSPSIPS